MGVDQAFTEGLQQAHLVRPGDIDNGHALPACRNIGVGPRQMQAPRLAQGNGVVLHQCRRLGIGDIDGLEAVAVGNEQVAELQGHGVAAVQRHHVHQSRLQGLVQAQYHQACVGDDIGVVATQHHVPGTVEYAILVPGQVALEKVVARLAV